MEDQFVKKKNIIQRKIVYQQEISMFFALWFDVILLRTTYVKKICLSKAKK